MGADPLDLESILAERAGGDGAGLAPETTIGHVHLHVSRLAEAERFYVDVLGFELMQRYGPSALFVSAGGYHHHFGLNTWGRRWRAAAAARRAGPASRERADDHARRGRRRRTSAGGGGAVRIESRRVWWFTIRPAMRFC
jgi:catechol-2,3-dioxygenase